ncbi:MAG: BatA domain-containing protein, partial [Alphaproteobacteria bacterium]
MFAAPAVLLALLALPLLWRLLRVTPPAPRRLTFPAVRLLFGLEARHHEAARTPWWILLLRLMVAALVIVGLAQPLLGGRNNGGGGRKAMLVVAIDDGWAAAGDWEARRQAVDTLLRQAERQGRPAMLLTTAPPENGGPIAPSRPAPAGEIRDLALALKPKPWPVDRTAATAAIRGVDLGGSAQAVWVSDGLDDAGAAGFADVLQRFGALEVLTADGGPPARLLRPPPPEVGALTARVLRATGAGVAAPAGTGWLRAMDDAGQVLAREHFALAAGEGEVAVSLALPSELRNRVVRLDIESEPSVGAVVLLDDRWGRRPVGLLSGSPLKADLPLLSDVYYLERALAPVADIRRGEVRDLLGRDLSLLVLADVGRLGRPEITDIGAWIEAGGVLVRFAGPNLASEADDLLPVRLRSGERNTGGALTWERQPTLAAFEADGPFAGLASPPDVRVGVQVLAEPAPDLAARTWARLSDGTPLVTGARRGQGWVVLVHTTANADWSNLALSGLFVEMMERLLALSRGVGGDGGATTTTLPPLALLDGFGRLSPPPGGTLPLTAATFAATPVGPAHPPGFYGTDRARRALNLSASVRSLAPLGELPRGVTHRSLSRMSREIDLRPPLLAAALGLAIIDMLVSLGLRGVLAWRGVGAAALLATALTAAPAAAAAETRGVPRTGPDAFAL